MVVKAKESPADTKSRKEISGESRLRIASEPSYPEAMKAVARASASAQVGAITEALRMSVSAG